MNLLDLPPELVAKIWSLIPQRNKAAMRPVCRALLPLSRRVLFRQVTLRSVAHLTRFHRVLFPSSKRQAQALLKSLKNDRPLAAHVQTLLLPPFDYFSYDEEEAEGLPECKALWQILSGTIELVELTMSGSAVTKQFLAGAKYGFLPQLRTLRIADLDARHMLLYDMNRFERLRYLPRLEILELSIAQQWEDDGGPSTALLRLPSITNVKTLILSAGVSISTSAAAAFVSHFTALTTLTLILTDLAELSLFLEAAPLTLTSLSISFDVDLQWEEEDERVNVEQQVSRFHNLTSLNLGERTFSADPFGALSESLASLRSLSLECGFHPNLDAVQLLDHLRVRHGSAPLQELNIDAFYADAGLLPSAHPERDDVAQGTFDIPGHWDLPTWTNRFSFDHAKEIVKTTNELGMKLDGSLVETIVVWWKS
ncbi:hypothetical protein JCM11251_000654 [Rhodosporidiobolus azoricus]